MTLFLFLLLGQAISTITSKHMNKKTILIFTDHYLPCKTSGGPVITVQNMIRNYHDRYDFYIVCLNRDLDSNEEYPFKTNEFLARENYHCMYVREFNNSIFNMLISRNFDVYYCLGTYSKYTRFFLSKKNQNKIGDSLLVIAPMGNFSSGAMAIKHFKKKMFFTLYKRKFNSKKITWSFTSSLELKEATHVLGDNIISTAHICPDPIFFDDRFINKPFDDKSDTFVFISRICQKKGLLDGIRALKKMDVSCSLDIYGSVEDVEYWNKCLSEAKDTKIYLQYKGEKNHDEIVMTFSKYRFFLFLTKGENFGHVIFESLNGGCLPIVTKSVTPWDNLLESIANYENIRDDLMQIFNLTDVEKDIIAKQCVDAAKHYFEAENKGNFIKMIEGLENDK